jgi:hypothetical protein
VLAANRAYLAAALPDAPAGAGKRWVLTCLPSTRTSSGRPRLSAVSARNMETFVLHVDESVGPSSIGGFVVLRRSAALAGHDTKDALIRRLGLDEAHVRPYHAAGEDQMTLHGSPEALIGALADPHVAAAARELAEFLTTSGTVYARFHNPYLTALVLDRGIDRPPG